MPVPACLRARLGLSPADELDNFEAVLVAEARFRPAVPPDDVPVQFDGHPVFFQFEQTKEVLQADRRRNFAGLSVDEDFHFLIPNAADAERNKF